MVTVPGKSGVGHDLGLALVLFGVQHVVLHAAHVQHLAHQLADLHAGGTHQHRSAGLAQCFHLLDHGIVLLALGLEDHVLVIVRATMGRLVGITITSSL